jgi:transposase InsO family protein/predicted aspartyl protease
MQTVPEGEKMKKGSIQWVMESLTKPTKTCLGILKRWVNRSRRIEVEEGLIKELLSLEPDLRRAVLRELKKPRNWIRRVGQNSVFVPITLHTLDDRREFQMDALLDSGATGCYIDDGFVKAKGLNLETLPHAIPVYNADGSRNEAGPIRTVVKLRLQIDGHAEIFSFAVTNTGKSDVIIGFDWLHKHNPSIDWKLGKITFDKCPATCYLSDFGKEPEDEKVEDEETVEEGDRIWLKRIEELEEEQFLRAYSTHAQKFAEEAMKSTRQKSLEEIVPGYCLPDFLSVFEKTTFDKLPERKRWDHAIELKPGTEPFNSKIYPLSVDEQKELDKFIEEHLQSGRIRPSKSPIASPFFFIKKKDGSLRPVQDYRKLNEMTIKNRYPLPLISEVIHKLRRAKIFTKLDVRWGYNNVRIKEGDEWKAAFITNRGLYEPLVMFFGLTNSPATFQTMMNDLFRHLINEGVVIVYMDDILIYTETEEEHRRVVKEVLQVLKDNGLFLKPEKCEFESSEIEYLGLIIREGVTAMDPVKIKGITEWPQPHCKRDVQQFLGFINFYRRFIHQFAMIAAPLHALTRNAPWQWTASEQNAFEQLKISVTTAPVLTMPSDRDPFRVEADSSDYATGAVLSQLQNDNWQPIAYMSKSLNDTERNYDIHDKELLAIMRALDEWRHYLIGAQTPVEIWTDHKNIEYFRTARKLNRRQARWSLELAEYNFTIIHKPGKTHLKPDILSRRPDHKRGEDDNKDVVLLKPQCFRSMVTEVDGISSGWMERIRGSNKVEGRIKEKVRKGEKGWTQENGIITWNQRVYVPKKRDLRMEIIRNHHDEPISGHPGRFKTVELVTRNYWWPAIVSDVRKYVEGCERCQRTKNFPTKPRGLLSPNRIPERNWQWISVDLITQLPPSLGYDAILVIVDRLSKLIRLAATNGGVTSEGIARLFRDKVWKDFGLPEGILSDQGSQFVSNFMRDLNKLLGIQTNISTAYHPQTDGQTERVNQEIEQYLRLFVNYRQDDWVDWLPMAEFSYNNKTHSSTGQSPFFLTYGSHPRRGDEPRREVKTESAQGFAERMKNVREDAMTALTRAAKDMARFYDAHRQEAPEYKKGDKVYLEGTNIRSDRPTKKLDDKRYGPFEVKEKVGLRAYRLKLPPMWKRIHPVFHTSLLRRYNPPSFKTQENPPPPPMVDIEGIPKREVAEILDSRRRRGKIQYLVSWKGYPREENTWEPMGQIKHAKRALKEYLVRKPNAVTIKIPSPKNVSDSDTPIIRVTHTEGTSERDIPFTIPNQGVYDPDLGSFRLLTRKGIRQVYVSMRTSTSEGG